MTASPPEKDVARELARWARDRFGEATTIADGPHAITGGLDTYIYRFRLAPGELPGPLVLRVYPSAARGQSAARESAILGFLAGVGYPAPRPFDHRSDLAYFGAPFVVMEQLEGNTVLDRVGALPTNAPALLDSLAAAQAALHALDPSGWPFPLTDPATSEIERRLADVGDESPMSDPALVRALGWLRDNQHLVRGEEPAICHYDFHPLNALVADDGRMAIIDWEGAGLGDRHSDLARALVLYEWAPVVASSRAERIVLKAARPWMTKRYTRAYARHLPIDEARLRYWMALHAADSWWEASTLLAGTFARETRTETRLGPAAIVGPAMAKLFHRLVPNA